MSRLSLPSERLEATDLQQKSSSKHTAVHQTRREERRRKEEAQQREHDGLLTRFLLGNSVKQMYCRRYNRRYNRSLWHKVTRCLFPPLDCFDLVWWQRWWLWCRTDTSSVPVPARTLKNGERHFYWTYFLITILLPFLSYYIICSGLDWMYTTFSIGFISWSWHWGGKRRQWSKVMCVTLHAVYIHQISRLISKKGLNWWSKLIYCQDMNDH